MINKIKTFQDLWSALSAYSDFFIYNDTHGEQYNAISQETDGSRFEFHNVNCDSDNLFIQPSAQVEDLEFVSETLKFEVLLAPDEAITLYLQVRQAPNIQLFEF